MSLVFGATRCNLRLNPCVSLGWMYRLPSESWQEVLKSNCRRLFSSNGLKNPCYTTNHCENRLVVSNTGIILRLSQAEKRGQVNWSQKRNFWRKQEYGHRIKEDPTLPTPARSILYFVTLVVPWFLFFDWPWIIDTYAPHDVSLFLFKTWHSYRMMWRKFLGLDTWEYKEYKRSDFDQNKFR